MLKVYWATPQAAVKAGQMSKARSKVVNVFHVGRSGKAGMKAQLVQANLVAQATCFISVSSFEKYFLSICNCIQLFDP
jgi:hypothetical protein